MSSGTALAKAWAVIRSWQLANGGWRPAAQVGSATWVTALDLTLCCVERIYDHQFRMATHWLLRESAVWFDRNTDEVRAAQRDADYT